MQGSDTGLPVGTIITWPTANWQQDMKTAGGKPDNFLECNGQVVDAAKYPKLAKIMAAVPNYQGIFLRGYGSQSFAQVNGSLNGITTTTYSSNNIGTIQGDAIRKIYGTNNIYKGAENVSPFGVFKNTSMNGYQSNTGHTSDAWVNIYTLWVFDSSLVVPTSNENRPINTAVTYLICAK